MRVIPRCVSAISALTVLAALVGPGLPVLTATASPLLFEITFSPTSGSNCIQLLPTLPPSCVPASLAAFSKTFTLDDSALGAPGAYDVLASISPPFYVPATAVSPTLIGNAIVAGGGVSDLEVQIDASGTELAPVVSVLGTRTVIWSLNDGAFSAQGRFLVSGPLGSWNVQDDSLSGTYSIRAVPEPSSVLLTGTMLTTIAIARRWRR